MGLAAWMRISATLLLTVLSLAPQWNQWRGPNRDGVVPAASVPAAWPVKLALKWRQPLGEGYSSPVVADGRVFVHSRTDPDETGEALVVRDAESVAAWTLK